MHARCCSAANRIGRQHGAPQARQAAGSAKCGKHEPIGAKNAPDEQESARQVVDVV